MPKPVLDRRMLNRTLLALLRFLAPDADVRSVDVAVLE
jgi:hypothetical protein